MSVPGYLVTIADRIVRWCTNCQRQAYIFVTTDDPTTAWCGSCQHRNGEYKP